jgi:hypothetical protein
MSVSLRPGRIRGVNLHESASHVRVTKVLDKANQADYDGLLLPGAFINPDLLRQLARHVNSCARPCSLDTFGGYFSGQGALRTPVSSRTPALRKGGDVDTLLH